MGLRWVIASVAAIVAVAVWCAPAGAIVGGYVTDIRDAPYQVALVARDKGAASTFCGGSITQDLRHIITAAHCVFDNERTAAGQPLAPSAVDIVAGTTRLYDYAGSGGRWLVTDVSLDKDYNPATFSHDAAVLTLGGKLDESEDIKAIPLAQPLDLELAPDATVSGWGQTAANDPDSLASELQSAQIPIHADSVCQSQYTWFVPEVMICAGNEGSDTCEGDSGGPLVVQGQFQTAGDPDPRLAGITSWGPPEGCALPDRPAGYTEVVNEEIASYLSSPNPVSAPRTVSPPSLLGTVAVGSTITCDPGAWQGADLQFSYQFVSPTPSGDRERTAQGSQSSYVIQPGDAGATLRCDVEGRNAGGLAFASSAGVTVPVPQTPPQTQPSTPSTTTPSPTASQQDSAAPVARVVKTRCTSTRCTLTVTVSDAGFSAGIQTVNAAVRSTYRTTCKRKGKRVACTKTRRGKPSLKALSATRFRVVASKLPVGKQVFTLVAVDKAGHRQALPTTKTVTTKKPKTRR